MLRLGYITSIYHKNQPSMHVGKYTIPKGYNSNNPFENLNAKPPAVASTQVLNFLDRAAQAAAAGPSSVGVSGVARAPPQTAPAPRGGVSDVEVEQWAVMKFTTPGVV